MRNCLFGFIPLLLLALLGLASFASGGRATAGKWVTSPGTLRRILLACEADMRFLHPHDAALTVDLNAAPRVPSYIRKGRMRWELDGVMNARGGREAFECTAIRLRSGLSVLHTNAPLWYTPPPS
ncbi:hypothetical protein CVO96_04320 [Deinococcus koreensis]|uniref:Uncharacterized protein n=1 Tax=Deinococcus koreensis TaxID=2054903 RepID=A0A2K3UVY7_9DEIO|nr:hypothetical protein CVO96_04320 [Deinococcus koreensis]